MASLASLIKSLRTLASDGPEDKVQFDENIGSNAALPVDGTNTNFRLGSIPVVPGSVYLTITGSGAGNAYRTQDPTVFKVTDYANGTISFVAAPASGKTITADYNHTYFSDAKFKEFLEQGSENLQLSETPADPTTVVTGLIPALMQYALANFFMSRYAQYASRYSSSGGQAGHSIDSVPASYLKAANGAQKRGDELRKSYYGDKQGQALSPAYGSTNSQGSQIASGIDPITPGR